MTTRSGYTINIRGRLLDLGEPWVMGILNATPDSFFEGSRCLKASDGSQTDEQMELAEAAIAARVRQIVDEAAVLGSGRGAIIDVGACSTRPGGELATEAEEMKRLRIALAVVRRECPDAVVSVDTFRPEVARMAVEECGADIINDVSGGSGEMFDVVVRLRAPYILCSAANTIGAMLNDFAVAIQSLRDRGVKDIILDPGFGFGKTRSENFAILSNMERLQVFGLPILVGVSRKRMVYETLGTTPDGSLNGTTSLNTVALMKGAAIIRVHDVGEAAECILLAKACEEAAG